MEQLSRYRSDVYRCIHCRACRFAYSGEPDREGPGNYSGIVTGCVSGNEFEWEAFWGSGRMWIIRAILEGDLKPSQDVADALFRCTTCGNCEAQCDNNIPLPEIIEVARAFCVRSGVPAIPKHEGIVESVIANNNPYHEKHSDRTKWYSGPKDQLAEMAYFVGCTSAYRETSVARALLSLLGKMRVEVAVLSDEVCCGSPLLRIGQTEVAEKLMQKNIETFTKLGVKKLIFSCAGCYRTFKIDYPKYVGSLPFELSHASEYAYDLAEKGLLKPSKQLKIRATWHDPCHLGRHVTLWLKRKSNVETPDLRKSRNEWFEKPRRILRSIPGLELVEMYRIKENSWCCGAGGGVKSAFPDFALDASIERIKEAEAVGASAIVTSCPFCLRNFNDAVRAKGSKLEVYELIELLDRTF